MGSRQFITKPPFSQVTLGCIKLTIKPAWNINQLYQFYYRGCTPPPWLLGIYLDFMTVLRN